MSAHGFHDTDAPMRFDGRPNPFRCFHSDIDGRVKSNVTSVQLRSLSIVLGQPTVFSL